jgi:hypothetical protein
MGCSKLPAGNNAENDSARAAVREEVLEERKIL